MRFIRLSLALLYATMLVLVPSIHLVADPCIPEVAHACCGDAADHHTDNNQSPSEDHHNNEHHPDCCAICQLMAMQAESPVAAPAIFVPMRMQTVFAPSASIHTTETIPTQKARAPPTLIA